MNAIYTGSNIGFCKYTNTKENRIYWVDFAKSLGVFLVFFGHTFLYGGCHIMSGINRAIYSFHMPMFFVLSGYVTKPRTTTLKYYIKQRFERIIIPALFFYVLMLPVFLQCVDWQNTTFNSIIARVFYIYGELAYNKPVWFFICMFQILLLVKMFNLQNAKVGVLLLVGISSLFLSYFMYYLGWKLFKLFGLNKCILGLFFYVCGMLLGRTRYNENIKIVGIALLPVWILTGIILNSKVSMYSMSLGNFWLFIVSGLTGSLAFFALSSFFENNTKIREYAKWTVFIVSSHYVLVVSLYRFLSVYFSFESSCMYDIISVCFVILSLILYKPLCRWVENRFPALI